MKRIKPFAYLLIAAGLCACNAPKEETSFQKNEPVNFSQVK